ncbi:hypothetical protein JIG36_47920 [Actinoplanes sp. LDG1-06]|uniref:Uncharacterized protein n=1 Tax=Paractinoplanes ovalisporus TaxID=2810368 RepID=A0ABS2ATW6_9ACTN|nr:hypothetical protein [Actinoplanes ovalisporus]MBM2623251.1 hypothetical protein [Actinoplanes ovalisporus]
MASSRRTGWVILAAVAGAVVAGSLTARRRRHPADPPTRLPEPSPLPTSPPLSEPSALPISPSPLSGPPTSDPSRALVRMAVWAGVVVVLCILTVVVTRPDEPAPRRFDALTALPHPPPSGPSPWPVTAPLPLAACQSLIAERPTLTYGICGDETAGFDRLHDAPSADPNDPRYAGAALPTGLSTDGRICVAGSERPVLDTVRPTLSASFTQTDGLRSIQSTFQITGVYGRTAEDLQLPGDSGDPLKATLELFRHGRLKHGESYRWRVRGTPPSIGAGGWSPWCEFTIPARTPDDLGLDDNRDYRATLTPAQWREVMKVGPGRMDAIGPIEAAAKATGPAPVTLEGRVWTDVVNALAWTASQNDDQAVWDLADLVSSALNGPSHVTMGHPRN